MKFTLHQRELNHDKWFIKRYRWHSTITADVSVTIVLPQASLVKNAGRNTGNKVLGVLVIVFCFSSHQMYSGDILLHCSERVQVEDNVLEHAEQGVLC